MEGGVWDAVDASKQWHPTRYPPRSTSAFTLIELLVVVAIIALLISILLPSLRAARDMARASVCMANMRHLGVTSHIYVADNNAWWPVGGDMQTRDLGFDKSPLWTYVLAQIVGMDYSTEHGDYVNVPPFDSFLTLNRGGSKDNGVFQCPSDNFANFWGGPNACSYGWNGGWNYKYGMGLSDFEGPGQGIYPELDHMDEFGRVRDHDVHAPTETFVVADVLGSQRLVIYEEALTRLHSIYHQTGQLADLHRGAGNYLWCDGHVSPMHPDEVLVRHFDRRQ